MNHLETSRKILTENLERKFTADNKGREGKPVAKSDGSEREDTIYLGDATWIDKHNKGEVAIVQADGNNFNTLYISDKLAKTLKKYL